MARAAGVSTAVPSAMPRRVAVTTNWFLYGLIPGLVVALGLARLWTGPWYQTYQPIGVVQLDGLPASWEVGYYLPHFPSFLGDRAPQYVFGLVHRRVFVSLFLTTMVYGWTGSAYWSLAAVDMAWWAAAGVATFHVSARLGAGRAAAAAAALLTVASPLFVAGMWEHVLHPAEFASMAVGLWAAVVLFEEQRSPWRLALALGALLFFLSAAYQYQWLLVPLLVVLALFRPASERRAWTVAAVAAVGLYLLADRAFGHLLQAVVAPDATDYLSGAVAVPTQLVAAALGKVSSPFDLVSAVELPRVAGMLVGAYHPVVFVAGVAGLALAPWRTRCLAVAAELAAAGATLLYPTPWTAMGAYPVIYLGVALTCLAAGRYVARGLVQLKILRDTPVLRRRLPAVVAAAGVVSCAALTNLDLVGRQHFLVQWWSYYAARPVF